jgi:hypothetical protein
MGREDRYTQTPLYPRRQADGGIRTLDPLYESARGVETEGSEGASEGIDALQIRLFYGPRR